MASKNQLLGFSAEAEKVEEEVVLPELLKLYREDWPEGREFEGVEMIAMMRRKGWKEQLVKQPKKPVKPSKIDLSEED